MKILNIVIIYIFIIVKVPILIGTFKFIQYRKTKFNFSYFKLIKIFQLFYKYILPSNFILNI